MTYTPCVYIYIYISYLYRIIMNYVYVYVYTLIESPISWYIPKTFPKHLSPRKHTTAKSDGLSPAEKLR